MAGTTLVAGPCQSCFNQWEHHCAVPTATTSHTAPHQYVEHDGRAHTQPGVPQRPAQHRPQVGLKLGGGAGLDGVVTAVVGPGGHLVQQDGAVGQQERLHPKHARACSVSKVCDDMFACIVHVCVWVGG